MKRVTVANTMKNILNLKERKVKKIKYPTSLKKKKIEQKEKHEENKNFPFVHIDVAKFPVASKLNFLKLFLFVPSLTTTVLIFET